MAHTDEEIEVILQENQESCLDEIISPLCGWICWQTVQSHKILTDLTSVFGSEQARNLINLAIYVYLNSNGALQIYEDRLPQNWLPHAKTLDSSQTSALLAEVTEQQCKDYFRLRFQRVKDFYQGIGLKEGDDLLPQFLALDSTCIQSYSETIYDAAYGHAKQRPDLKQINYTLAVDYLTGQTCYALECKGSITDKALYPDILANMISSGFQLDNTIFVTDRGYNSLFNVQQLINANLKYLTGVPLSEDSVRSKILKYEQSFASSAFYKSSAGVAARTFEEKWQQVLPQTETTSSTTQYLHLYVNPDLQLAEFKDLQKKVALVLEKYEKAEKIDNGLLTQVKSFILKSEHKGKEQWSKNIKSLDKAKCTKGAWAIRTNCVQDPVKALLISRRRSVVETSFRAFKVENGGNKLRCTQSSFHGKLFVLSLAQSLRNLHLSNVNNFVDPPEPLQPYLQETLKANKVKIPETDRKQMKLPGDSLTKAFSRLARYKAVRASSSRAWVMKKPLPKKTET